MKTKSIFVAISFFVPFIGAKAQLPAYMDESQPMETRINDAISRMTLEEKVAICHANSKFNTWGVPRLGIPGLQMSDGPHGVREEMDWSQWKTAGWTNDSCTAFPALTCLAATWNPEMAWSAVPPVHLVDLKHVQKPFHDFRMTVQSRYHLPDIIIIQDVGANLVFLIFCCFHCHSFLTGTATYPA